jgi:hypothetical protein
MTSTKRIWIAMIKTKDQVLEELKKFTRKKITNIRIKVLRIENGGECLSSKFL